jgi:DNA-binding NtrC family response regulator
VPNLVQKWLSSLHADAVQPKLENEAAASGLRTRHPVPSIRVFAITSSEQILQALKTIADSHGWEFSSAGSWEKALEIIEHRGNGVVLVDREILGTEWKDALGSLLHPRRRCCVILMLSQAATDRFCLEFIREGGYKILKTPLIDAQVVATVRLASAFWTTCVFRRS